MLLITHIIIALSGLVSTGLANLKPSGRKIAVSYSLIGLTLASGSVLVATTHASLTGACISGLVYLAVNLAGLSFARRRLVAQRQKIDV